MTEDRLLEIVANMVWRGRAYPAEYSSTEIAQKIIAKVRDCPPPEPIYMHRYATSAGEAIPDGGA